MATKWGIVSAGKICHDFVTAVRSMPDSDKQHQFVAVAARKIEDSEKFAKLHNIPAYYGSYEEIATNPDVEIVYIGSINPYHYPLTKLMLEAGKHVLVEKPLTMNLKHTKELTKLARDKKLFLMEAVWSRFLPAYQHLSRELSAGSIGEVRYVHCTFGQPLADVDRILKKVLGGTHLDRLRFYTISMSTPPITQIILLFLWPVRYLETSIYWTMRSPDPETLTTATSSKAIKITRRKIP